MIFTYVDVEKRVHLKLNIKFLENTVEQAYENKKHAPLLYVFLKALVRPVYIKEIQQAEQQKRLYLRLCKVLLTAHFTEKLH